MNLTEADLLEYLRDEHFIDTDGITGTTPLFSDGIIDSMALVEMMTFIMERTGVEFEAGDITLENLDTIELTLQFVARRIEELCK